MFCDDARPRRACFVTTRCHGAQAEYLRTLELDHFRSLALVHWWYLPDSRDEWMPLANIEGQPPEAVAVLAVRTQSRKGTRGLVRKRCIPTRKAQKKGPNR